MPLGCGLSTQHDRWSPSAARDQLHQPFARRHDGKLQPIQRGHKLVPAAVLLGRGDGPAAGEGKGEGDHQPGIDVGLLGHHSRDIGQRQALLTDHDRVADHGHGGPRLAAPQPAEKRLIDPHHVGLLLQ